MGLLGSIAGPLFQTAGAFLGAKAQKKAAKKAGQFVQTAADSNNALATAQFTPYTQAGASAMGQANNLLGLGGQEAATNAFSTFQQSPGYQFRLQEGMNQMNSGYAGAGVLQSGAALRGAQEYGQDYASNEFDRYFGRVQNQAQLGLGATNALVGNVSNNNIYAADGQANAALIRGNSNPFASALGQLGGSISGGGNPLAAFGLKF